MNRRIEQLENSLAEEYERQYQRILVDELRYYELHGKRRQDEEPHVEKWEYKGDTY